MDFVALENAGKKIFEQFPVIKRICKRVYQLSMYAISKEKFKVDGEVIRVSPEDEYEYFYGYYDKSPWDATDRYMLCIRVKQAYKSVAPKESGEVVIIDTENNNKVIKIGTTNSWNVQQGCMVQWLGPDFSEKIIYNDFRNGEYCSVIFNVKLNIEERVLKKPVYDVSRDGKFALSLDFSRLHRLRKGYGYSNLPDVTESELCPDKTCIWKINLDTNEVVDLLKYTDFSNFEANETMIGAEHKVNHIMISPNGKRFMVLHRWFQRGRKNTRLVTVNCDGSDMYNLSDDVFVSHCYWKNDEEILSFLRKKETGDHYYLMKDRTQEYKMLWPELNTDGHCSYSPNGNLIITDTYPNRKRLAYAFVCKENGEVKKIASVFAPFRYDNDVRCDLHPRWNREGNKVCIDSVHNGKRALYVIDLSQQIDDLEIDKRNSDSLRYTKNSPIISFIIPAYNAEKTISRCIDSLLAQDNEAWEAIVIDDGSIDRTLEVLNKYKINNNIKILKQSNQGPGMARNNGIQHAMAEYISFLDSDDYMESNFVSSMQSIVGKHNSDVVFYETFYEDLEGNILKKSNISKYENNNMLDFITLQLSGKFSWGAVKIIKRNIIESNKIFFSNHDVGEEAIFTFDVLRNSQVISFLKKPMYHYVQSNEGQHKKGDVDPLYNTVYEMKKHMMDKGLYDKYEVALNNMAMKALSMSLYRCSLKYKFTKAQIKMLEKINLYNKDFNFKKLDKEKLNQSAKLLLPFIRCKITIPIYVASKLRNKE